MAIDEIARLTAEPVLIVGSLPPEGRDLDLLVRPAAARSIASGLTERGWIRQGSTWASFDGCSAEVVELLRAWDFSLRDRELEPLFAESASFDGSEILRAPAPHHTLLLLSRRFVHGDGSLSEKHRQRLDALLLRDSAAWRRAEAIAPSWGAAAALAGLHAAYTSGEPMGPARRAAAVAEELAHRGDAHLLAAAKGWRSALRIRPPRSRRGFIIAFSGLDGSGKSTQAQALRETLTRLGFDAEVSWTSIAHYPGLLEALRRAVNRGLTVISRAPAPDTVDTGAGQALGELPTRAGVAPPVTAAKRLRRRSGTVAFVWITLVAARNALEQRRVTRARHSKSHVVICDRYVLDSVVQLHYEYGAHHDLRFQSWLLRALPRKPALALLLDVSAEAACARKADYNVEENARRAGLYAQFADQLQIMHVDGERPLPEVCAELATRVWTELRR